jgi:hypothetical protein
VLEELRFESAGAGSVILRRKPGAHAVSVGDVVKRSLSTGFTKGHAAHSTRGPGMFKEVVG